MGVLTNAMWRIVAGLNWFGAWLPQLVLRLLLAWEFWEAGVQKFRGENWFADIQEKFPYPFNLVPVEISWSLATWTELIGAVLLVLGLFTRFASLSLIILTIVAIAAVHWPAEWLSFADLLRGYVITDKGFGNYKLPLILLVMLLPLLFSGAGRLSLDSIFARRFEGNSR